MARDDGASWNSFMGSDLPPGLWFRMSVPATLRQAAPSSGISRGMRCDSSDTRPNSPGARSDSCKSGDSRDAISRKHLATDTEIRLLQSRF